MENESITIPETKKDEVKQHTEKIYDISNVTCTHGGTSYNVGDAICHNHVKLICQNNGQWYNTREKC